MANNQQLEQKIQDFLHKECGSLKLVSFKAMVREHIAVVSFNIEHEGKNIPSCDLVDLNLIKENKLEFIEDNITQMIREDSSFDPKAMKVVEFTVS